MKLVDNDSRYSAIVRDILVHEEFSKIKNIEHHGISRYNHSLRVSYYSYKLAKILGLNSEEVARAGLLHDFFLTDGQNSKEKFTSTFTHPKLAKETASTYFNLNDKEKDIIASHMFPFCLNVPKYGESWIVNIVDKVIGTYEFYKQYGYKFTYAANVYLLFLMNTMK